MCSAISETIGKLKEFGDLPEVSPVPMALLENAQALLSSTKDLRDALESIREKIHETTPPILLQGTLHYLRVYLAVLNLSL